MIELSVEQNQLAQLGARLAAEGDGARLKRDLTRELRSAVAPAVAEIKSGALKIKRSHSVAHRPTKKRPVPESSISLGAAIARGIGTSVRVKGNAAGVSVKARKAGMPRGFANAPKRINAVKFRHPVFGHDRWVDQVGAPGFFDDPLKRGHLAYRAACVRAMEDMAARLGS